MKAETKRQDSNWEKLDVYRQVLDGADVILVILDSSGKVIFINQRACKLIGDTQENIAGNDWFLQYIPSESYPEKIRDFYQKKLSDTKDVVWHREYLLKTESRKLRLIKWGIKLIFSEKGEIIGFVNSGEDVTTQRKLVKELHRSEEKYRYLVDESPAGIFQTNLKGDILYVNPQMIKIFEYPSQQKMLEANILNHYPDVSIRNKLLDILKSEGYFNNIEIEMLSTTKKPRTVIANSELKDGIITGTFLDISDLVATRNKLDERESQIRELFDKGADPMFLVNSKGFFC